MSRYFYFAAFFCLAIAGSIGSADESLAPPHWIWSRDTSGVATVAVENERCRFERRFTLDAPPRSAALHIAADFCSAKIEINGRTVAAAEPYSQALDLDVAPAIRGGENVIHIAAEAIPGPAAIALSLRMTSAGGQQINLITDSQWRGIGSGDHVGAATSLGSVDPALWGLGRRPATIDPFDNYEQWRQAIGTAAALNQAAFWTAPGFVISLVRQAQPDEGSWISMAFDPRGRLTISREDKGLLRMTLDEQRSSIERVETINSDLQECRGLLYAYDALYANANNSKGMYRLRDTDGDDKLDEVRLVREFPGSTGHGRNDLALGADGLIYSIHGDAVDVPKENISDHTSPFREARRGKNTREGHLLRTDRDGQQWELLAAGIRNPYGIAFNSRGDLFTYDADAEFDMGSPWYRPTRVDQLVGGADFGWRGVTGKWPPYFPDHADNALPTLEIGRGSPTAVAFGTNSNFPPDYRRALFVLDWAYGRVLAVHFAPRGAGYRAAAEAFLKGRPLNVTDLAFGPDGALYLITGGRKTQSALYRVAYTGPAVADLPRSAHEAACMKHADEARRLRIDLESRHREIGAEAVDFAWPHLASVDPAIRFAARAAIEHQPLDLWRDRALASEGRAALAGLLALARSGDEHSTPRIVDRLLRLDVKELSIGDALALLQAYFLCSQHAPGAIESRRDEILAKFSPSFPHPAASNTSVSPVGTAAYLNRELARFLVQLGSPSIIQKVTQSLLSSTRQEDRLQGLFVLRNVTTGWTKDARQAYFATLNEAGSFVGGEGMPKFLAQIREQAIAMLSDRERAELADLLTPRANTEDAPQSNRPLVKHWTLEELEPLLRDSAMKGDAARGEIVFCEALCARCHRAGARGSAVGPDLTHVAGRFSQRDILESILSPSKVVAENYRNVQITTTDGRQIVGRLLIEGDFRSEKLRIATEPLRPSTIVEISKRDIDQTRETDTSPMPQGLLDSFQPQEVLNLLAFLSSVPAPVWDGTN